MVTSLGFLLWVGIGSFMNGVKVQHSEFSTSGCNATALPFTVKPDDVTEVRYVCVYMCVCVCVFVCLYMCIIVYSVGICGYSYLVNQRM